MEMPPMDATELRQCKAAGFSMLETLVAIFIVTIGLLGIAGLQAKSQVAEFESYQRAQALIIMGDIVDKINIARNIASCFAVSSATTGTPYFGPATNPDGTSDSGAVASPACGAGTIAENALAVSMMTDINSALAGSGETKSGASVGAMVGARGCVSYSSATEIVDTTGASLSGTGQYTVAVSWQGRADTSTPTVNCGNNKYGTETQRRTVSWTFRAGKLK